MSNLTFKEISLESKDTFDNYFSKLEIEISELTFTNLFVWRKTRPIHYSEFKGGFLLLAGGDKGNYFMPPLGYENYVETVSFLLDYGIINNIADSIKRVCQTRIAGIEESGLKVTEDRDNFDYVYSAEDLAHLKGRKYSGKRNIIMNFFNEYECEYKRYDGSMLEGCLELCDIWLSKKSQEDKSLYDEYLAIKELLANSEKLDAKGGVLLIDGKIEAFAFGERLNEKTFVIHFEKANPEYKGIYQAINKLFVEKEIYGKFDFVNREQDLGISGLRKAKENYFPVSMVKKYIISGK